MDLQNAKSLSDLNDRELLETLLASHLLLHRKIDDVVYKLDNMDIKEVPSDQKTHMNNWNDTLDDMVDKIPRFIEGINKYLETQER